MHDLEQLRKAPSASSVIKRMRQQKLSYRKAAAATGYPHSYIYEVLHGKRLNPGYRVRIRITELLDSLEKEKEAAK